MAENPKYRALPYLYKSIGLHAREAYDRCPEYSYIQSMNTLERDEEGMSSRYGYRIVNRDPYGTPNGQNYFFNYPVTSIAKMSFGSTVQRYVGCGDGSLWQRNSNSQGPFSEIYTGLSGNPFKTLIASCYETALPFLFIADEDASIKVAAGSSTAELWGIDPPPYTANALPYSPLLSLIDNFSASNSYVASGFDSGEPWAYAGITTIPVGASHIITDFPQFTNAGATTYRITPSPATVSTAAFVGDPETQNEQNYSGFGSVPIPAGATVTVSVTVEGMASYPSLPGQGYGIAYFTYSPNGGASYITYYGATLGVPSSFGPMSISFPVVGLSNLNQLQFQNVVYAVWQGGDIIEMSMSFVGAIQATVNVPGIFGDVCDGILSVLNSHAVTNVPIISITPSGLMGDVYTTLTIVTGANHGATSGQPISIYGASNDLADGFYNATVVNATTLTVPFLSPAGYPIGISATGGTLQYVSASNVGPNTCVLTQEYSTPYPAQVSAWGFYQQVPLNTTTFPVGCWSGLVDASSTAAVGATAAFDLSQNNQVTDSDLIVLTLQIGSPQNIANIRLQFDVNGSGYTSSYYYANITPSYYQGNIANTIAAYQTTQNQILADALGLLTGQPESSTTAQLQPSNFSTGESTWVAVLIPRGNFLPVGSAGQSGLDWTNITGWQVIIETAAAGGSTVALNGLYLQWGYGPSSFAGVGYDYRYTYYNANTGTESSPNGEMEFNQQYGYLSSLSAPFYLRQAAQVSGYFSPDPQVTHYRMYRRGGIYANNWLLIDQITNITSGGHFLYKDVVPDASLAQAQPLVLDNDPPVTSSLVTPILTTLSAATTGPGNSIYSTYAPQLIKVVSDTAVFVPNQTVLLGNAYNLEEVLVIAGGTGQFTAIVRLQHNAGEQVQVNSTPRVFCDLCCTVNLPGGATQVLLAGDKSNPHRVYYAKPNQPENFGPENYVDSSSPDDPVMALINWRGTGLVATRNTWYIFVGGAKPYLQPTGAAHGMIAKQGWTLVEGEVAFRAADGWRFFSGADGKYMTLPVEWIFRTNPDCLPPQASASNASLDVFAYYNNLVLGSYISLNDGIRYRLIYDTVYSRYRQDDLAATAMLWERDTNLLLCGVPVTTASNTIGYALVADQQYNQDYDDGGWNSASDSLVQTPINLTIQLPYKDVGKPHFPKQFNVLETDANTQNQELQTTLLFNTEPETSIVLPAVNSGSVRDKLQQKINNGDGQQAYAMSILHTMAVTVAPTLFQENIYAALLADYRTSFDSYWQKFEGDYLGIFPKNIYCDYTSTAQLIVSIYADGNDNFPYYVDDFTLIPQAHRSTVRVQLPARKGRLWRVIITSTEPCQLWAPIRTDTKPLCEGSGYEQKGFGVYE